MAFTRAVRRPTTPRAAGFPLRWLAGFLLTILSGSPAIASSLIYVSQSGNLSATGSTPTLGTGVQSLPVSGLDGVNAVVQVAAGTPPAFYSARADLQTSLASTALNVTGHATASAGPIFPGTTAFARSDAVVTLRFDLDEAALIRVGPVGSYSVNFASLRNLDVPFEVQWDYRGAYSVFCNPFESWCAQVLAAVTSPTGGTLPSGRYEMLYSLFAIQPQGSCASGCLSAGGTMRFAIVPEPGTGVLMMTGLLGLLCRHRRHRRAA